MKVKPCLHRVAYYETDQMGIVHHSNYIRWFEEARDEVVREYGIDYRQIEARGVLMPVVNVSCDYKSAAKYADQVSIYALPAISTASVSAMNTRCGARTAASSSREKASTASSTR